MINSLIYYLYRNQLIVAIIFVFLGWLVLQVRDVLVGLFISYIIMAALFPWVSFLRRKGIPNALSVSITYFFTLAFLVLLILPLVPFFVSQILSLYNSFPRYVDESARVLGFSITSGQIREFLASDINNIGKSAFTVTTKVFSGVLSVLTVLVVSFYLLLGHDQIKSKVIGLFARDSQKKALFTIARMEEKLGAWLRGQIILSLSIAFVTWITLTVLGIDFALPLALLAGILEIAPTIGPILAGIPAVIVALAISPSTALVVALAYTLIQFLENHILVPRIMQKAVGLHPVIIILGVIIGSHLLGVAGALLAVPFMSFLFVGFQNLKQIKE